MASRHVNEPLRALGDCSWALGDKVMLSRQKDNESIWRDSDGWHYSISNTSDPSSTAHVSSSPVPFPLVHDAGCGLRLDLGHAVWKIGNADLKVLAIDSQSTATREHMTLMALRQRNVAFTIPEVLVTANGKNATAFTTKVPGHSLRQAWWSISEEDKETAEFVTRE
jgi:hypothetical protein